MVRLRYFRVLHANCNYAHKHYQHPRREARIVPGRGTEVPLKLCSGGSNTKHNVVDLTCKHVRLPTNYRILLTP